MAVGIDLELVVRRIDLAGCEPAAQQTLHRLGEEVALEEALAPERRVLRDVHELVADEGQALDAVGLVLARGEGDHVSHGDGDGAVRREREELSCTLGIDGEHRALEDRGREADTAQDLSREKGAELRPDTLGQRRGHRAQGVPQIIEERGHGRRERIAEQIEVRIERRVGVGAAGDSAVGRITSAGGRADGRRLEPSPDCGCDRGTGERQREDRCRPASHPASRIAPLHAPSMTRVPVITQPEV